MNAASPTTSPIGSPRTVSFELDGLKRLIAFLIITGLFWVSDNYFLSYKQMAGTGDTRDAMALIDAAATGSVGSLRPLMFGLLAAFGIVCWMARPAGLRTSIHGLLPAVLSAFVIVVGMSILWCDEPDLVMRRVAAFMLFVVASWGLVHRFSNVDLMRLCFLFGGIAGALSLGSEIVTGTFKLGDPDFRLYGIMHANSLGATLAIFILAAFALRQRSDHRFWYLLAIGFGVALLLLTKSRSAMVGLAAGLAVWAFLGARDRRRAAWLGILALALIVPAVIFLFGEQLGSSIEKAVLMGRKAESLETGTGRLPLWEHLISHYVAERPFLGHGYQGFWTADHIRSVTASQDWLILHAHSGYMNVLLDLGLVGLCLFVLILVLSIVRSYAYFKATQDKSWLFITALLTWAAVASFFDTLLMSLSIRDFIGMLAIAKVVLFDPRAVRVREPVLAPAE